MGAPIEAYSKSVISDPVVQHMQEAETINFRKQLTDNRLRAGQSEADRILADCDIQDAAREKQMLSDTQMRNERWIHTVTPYLQAASYVAILLVAGYMIFFVGDQQGYIRGYKDGGTDTLQKVKEKLAQSFRGPPS